MKKSFLLCSASLLLVPACVSGPVIKDISYPTTPIEVPQMTRSGKACFKTGITGKSGNSAIMEAARNGGVNKIYMVEHGEEYELGGFITKKCTYVYGE